MKKLEKYIELKETVETFLKKRNELKKRKDLYEPIKISLLDYLCILNKSTKVGGITSYFLIYFIIFFFE